MIKIMKNFSYIIFFSDYDSLNNISTNKQKRVSQNDLHNCFVFNSKRTKIRKVCGCRIALALIFAFFKFQFFKFKLGISLIGMSFKGDQWELIYFRKTNKWFCIRKKRKGLWTARKTGKMFLNRKRNRQTFQNIERNRHYDYKQEEKQSSISEQKDK